MKKTGSYTDIVLNAFQSVQAWRSVALVLMGILLFETLSLVWVASQRTVLLVPQYMSAAKGSIDLKLGEPFSPDYLTAVARGDIFSLLNWTPENIEAQYGLFLARATPGLNSAQRVPLLAEAALHKSEGLTQSFYVTRTVVSGADVTLSGILVRATAGREIFRGPASYSMGYENTGDGMLYIAGVSQPGPAAGAIAQ